MVNKKYENKVKKKLIANGFLKIEKTTNNEDSFFIYEFDPKLKSKYRLINQFVGDWEFTREVIYLDRIEGWERLKIIKLYPSLKKYFYNDNRKFCKFFKIEIIKKQLGRRGSKVWDKINMLTGEKTISPTKKKMDYLG